MKKLNAFFVSILTTAVLNAAVIEQVIVRQQWPWSTDVKVEYKISAVTNPVDITVQAFNGVIELALPKEAITGERYGITEDGVGTFVIDPVKAFGAEKVALANFKVKLTVSDSVANVNEVIYKIFDLQTGEIEELTRAKILNGEYGSYETDFGAIGEGYQTTLSDVLIWTGVTNYPGAKTSKLVMRKVSAAGVDWTMGRNPGDTTTAENETPHPVRLTKDFWIGVFETTMGQRKCITGGKSSSDNAMRQNDGYGSATFTNMEYIAERPVHLGSYRWTHYPRLAEINEKFPSVTFAFPTEAQWEFACRAGSTTRWNSGLSSGAELLGRYYANGGKKWSETTHDWTSFHPRDCTGEYGVAPVGWYRPNALGLYDMHGNAGEVCADAYYADYGVPDKSVVTEDPGLDHLLGTATTGKAAYRGGNWSSLSLGSIGTPNRLSVDVTNAGDSSAGYHGFRLCITED